MPRRAARVDEIQPECVKALRAIGATVQPLHTAGDGVPDLLIGYMGCTLLAEVKGPASIKRRKRDDGRTPKQVEWHAKWTGEPPILAKSAEQLVDDVRRIVADRRPEAHVWQVS